MNSTSTQQPRLKLAILDMNRGQANQGMRCIRKIVSDYSDYLIVEEFDVRVKNQLPDIDFDIFISSGGPGNPLEGNGIWEHRFAHLVDRIWEHNKQEHVAKKHFFFICHSFQLACNHFGLGEITKRRSTSFGVYPVHKTEAGKKDVLLSTIDDPYWVVDSRDWQLIQPNLEVFEEKGAKILSLEKIRTHIELERAIMAVRFSDEMVGTQYHPEADPDGMEEHFKKEENRQKVIDNFGVEKYEEMMAKLADPDKLWNTHNSILPRFIEHALQKLCVIQPETV